jgi:hypothetical protein
MNTKYQTITPTLFTPPKCKLMLETSHPNYASYSLAMRKMFMSLVSVNDKCKEEDKIETCQINFD